VIAQVFSVSGTAGPPPAGGAGEKGIADTRAADGCEGLYVLIDPAGGDGMAIVMWRDEAAMKAWSSRQNDDLRAVREETPDLKISAPKVY
jgi:hypothetical protein